MNKALYLRVNVLNTKVLIGDNIYIFFYMGVPLHVLIRVTQRFSRLQSKGNTFSCQLYSCLRPRVLVRPGKSNLRPPALQSRALPTELIRQGHRKTEGTC